jgi:hypothetical protein
MGANILQLSDRRLDVLHGLRKVVIRLQRYPEPGRADPGLLQPDRQIRADACPTVQYARERDPRHAQSFRSLLHRQAKRHEHILFNISPGCGGFFIMRRLL